MQPTNQPGKQANKPTNKHANNSYGRGLNPTLSNTWGLRYVFRDCELQSAVRSHVGPEREQMLEGIHWYPGSWLAFLFVETPFLARCFLATCFWVFRFFWFGLQRKYAEFSALLKGTPDFDYLGLRTECPL